MQYLRNHIFTLLGLLFFVFLPGFAIISLHVETTMPIKDIEAVNVNGSAKIQYEVAHSFNPQGPIYRNISGWMPLFGGMKIGAGASVDVENAGCVDLMIPGGIGLRLSGPGRLRCIKGVEAKDAFEVVLENGRILCRVEGKASRKERLRVKTETAVAVIRGTIFSMECLENATGLTVIDGEVHLSSGRSDDLGVAVCENQTAHIDADSRLPIVKRGGAQIPPDLSRHGSLKTSVPLESRLDRVIDYLLAVPIYRWAYQEVTKYEMKVFARAIMVCSPIRWGNCVPARLQDVPLEEGDYKDPWESDYFYERQGDKRALIISAGPDRCLHTNDDIVVPVHCQSE